MSKSLIPIVLIISLLGGAGAFLISSRFSPAHSPTQIQEAQRHSLVEMPEFIVNLADKTHPHYLKTTITLEMFGASGAEDVEKANPYIRDAILTTLGWQHYEDLLTEQGKKNLKRQLRESIQLVLDKYDANISNVIFTSFVMD